MYTTSSTLLCRLKNRQDLIAWKRFVDLYTPLLTFWARRSGLQDSDAADVSQDVLCLLVNKLPGFNYDPDQTFRGWLHTVTVNKLRERLRRQTLPTGGEAGLSDDSAPDDLQAGWEDEYRRHLVASALTIMKTDFEPTTWQACWEHVVSGRTARDIAAELGLSESAVHVAKFRVLRRLREELAGLLD